MDINVNDIIVYILAIAGVIITIGGATSIIYRWWINSKGMKNQEQINKLDKRVESVETKTVRLERHQQENEEFTKIMCKSMLALLNHEITGNNFDKLKQAEEDIKAYLINK